MSEIYSIHTFMFPFRWDYIANNKDKENLSYSARTHMADFDRVFSSCNTLKRRPFDTIADNENYNEYTYFHEYARKALYDIGNTGIGISKNEVLYYDLDGGPGDNFVIKTIAGKEYELFPENFCLHVYSTGIGILSFNLRNTKQTSKDDILGINEFGRRIYPQFLADNSLSATKEAFLADRISGKIGNINFHEDFSQYLNSVSHHSTFLAPDHIRKIFGYQGQDVESKERSFVFRGEHERKGNIRISKLTDDRMFYLCYYHNPTLVNTLAKINLKQPTKFEYYKSSFWYAFIFGDKNEKDISVKNVDFQEKSIARHTYSRWVDSNAIDTKNYINPKNGTLFGMSKDSFVCVGGWDLLAIQMTTMYYQMAILCLAQRSSVLRFSYEVGLITNQLEENKDATRDIKDLYKNYIQFINKIYFREVTSQIQGIEMYNQFQDVMGLEKDVKDLDNEIKELHSYISMVEQSNLSKVAVWFLPAGVLVGILGMNTFADGTFRFESKVFDWLSINWIVGVVLVSILFAWSITQYFNRKSK